MTYDIDQQSQLPYVPRPQPTAIPTTAWNEAPLLCLQVNDQWAAHIYGALEALAQRDTWLGTEAEIDSALDTVDQIISALMEACVQQIFPQSDFLFHYGAKVITGNAINTVVNASQLFNFTARQDAAAQYDRFEQYPLLDTGTYTLTVLGLAAPSRGIVDWEIDGVSVGSMDFYAAAGAPNTVFSISDIVIGTPGRKTLAGIANSKNASASDYYITLTAYWLTRTGD